MHGHEAPTLENDSSDNRHAGHSPEMFRDRLAVSTALTIPILYFSAALAKAESAGRGSVVLMDDEAARALISLADRIRAASLPAPESCSLRQLAPCS